MMGGIPTNYRGEVIDGVMKKLLKDSMLQVNVLVLPYTEQIA